MWWNKYLSRFIIQNIYYYEMEFKIKEGWGTNTFQKPEGRRQNKNVELFYPVHHKTMGDQYQDRASQNVSKGRG